MDQSSSMFYGCVYVLPKNLLSNRSHTYIFLEGTYPSPATAPIVMKTLYLIIWLRSSGMLGVEVWTQRVLSVVPRAAYSYAYTL